MKFEISFQEPKIQVSWTLLKNVRGGKLNVYFFSGERYEHWTSIGGSGAGNLSLYISNDKGEDIGSIQVNAETDEEKEILNFPFSDWQSRNKETDTFLFLEQSVTETNPQTFQHVRTF